MSEYTEKSKQCTNLYSTSLVFASGITPLVWGCDMSSQVIIEGEYLQLLRYAVLVLITFIWRADKSWIIITRLEFFSMHTVSSRFEERTAEEPLA